MDVPREQSFSFQVPLVPFPWQAWFAGKDEIVSPAIPGNAYLFDLSNNPRVGLNTPFSTVRFNISQSALDALADERALRRTSGLCAMSLGCADAVTRAARLVLLGVSTAAASVGRRAIYLGLAARGSTPRLTPPPVRMRVRSFIH
jgi:hypothetical protein